MKKGLIPFSEKLTDFNFDIMETLQIVHFFKSFTRKKILLQVKVS